jgi:ABC-type Fe3+-hydroxamate transport system substrate-binding protein
MIMKKLILLITILLAGCTSVTVTPIEIMQIEDMFSERRSVTLMTGDAVEILLRLRRVKSIVQNEQVSTIGTYDVVISNMSDEAQCYKYSMAYDGFTVVAGKVAGKITVPPDYPVNLIRIRTGLSHNIDFLVPKNSKILITGLSPC